jgi:thymidine kinase
MLVFVYGTMAAGKSTVALQMAHSLSTVGAHVALWTAGDRSGTGEVTSRIGLRAEAIPIGDWTAEDVTKAAEAIAHHALMLGQHNAHVLVDEAQFLSPECVDALADAADTFRLEVTCFGLRVDFRGELFPGTRRLFEVVDRIEALPVPARCWCGQPGMHNARVNGDGVVVREGPQVMLGDIEPTGGPQQMQLVDDHIRYVILCRAHYRTGQATRDEGSSASQG